MRASLRRTGALLISLPLISNAGCKQTPEPNAAALQAAVPRAAAPCPAFPINTSAVSPPISHDSACVLAIRALASLRSLTDSSRGIVAADTAAIDSASVFDMALQIVGRSRIDSSIAINFSLRKPYDAEVEFRRGTDEITVRRTHKPL